MKVKKITALKGHTSSVYALEKGEYEHLVFSGSSYKFVALWNLKTLKAEKFAASFPCNGCFYLLCKR